MKCLWTIGMLALGLCLGCEDVFEGSDLKITGGPPPNGEVGQPYFFRMEGRISNNSNDDDFDYFFGKIDGTLPPGTGFTHGNNTAMVEGTPTQAGQFTFVVAATAIKETDSFLGDDDGSVERLNTEQVFVITIEQ